MMDTACGSLGRSERIRVGAGADGSLCSGTECEVCFWFLSSGGDCCKGLKRQLGTFRCWQFRWWHYGYHGVSLLYRRFRCQT